MSKRLSAEKNAVKGLRQGVVGKARVRLEGESAAGEGDCGAVGGNSA